MSPRAFTAHFSSLCPSCGDEIVGDVDEIVMTDDGAVHEDCAPSGEEFAVTFDL